MDVHSSRVTSRGTTPSRASAPSSVLMNLSLVRITRRQAARALILCAIVCACPTTAFALDSDTTRVDTARVDAAPIDAAKPFTAWSESVHSLRDSLVTLARAQVGKRYITGGQSPESGFDCSGLVRYVMSALHVDVPRTARQQAKVGLAIHRDTSRLRPGDLLTFSRNKRDVSHVGIYVGDGRFVHASSVAGQVIESNIDRPPAPRLRMWRGARRILAQADSARG